MQLNFCPVFWQGEFFPPRFWPKYLPVRQREEKKFASTKALPPDSKSLTNKILRANFVTDININCLEPHFVPPAPTNYAWEDLPLIDKRT